MLNFWEKKIFNYLSNDLDLKWIIPHSSLLTRWNEVYRCMVPHGFATFYAKLSPPHTTPCLQNEICRCIVSYRFTTFHVKRGIPHRLLLIERNEVCYYTITYGFAIFHAKWGLPHTALCLQGETESIIIMILHRFLIFYAKRGSLRTARLIFKIWRLSKIDT